MNDRAFDDKIGKLRSDISTCKRCKDINMNGALHVNSKEFGLNYLSKFNSEIKIMFIAESPPAFGKGFFYNDNSSNDLFRRRLFKLINMSGLGPVYSIDDFNNLKYFLADSLNCPWEKALHGKLCDKVFENCSGFLARQIELLKPEYIVTMGKMAQKAINFELPSRAVQALNIPKENILSMSLIVVASQETDKQRVEKLKRIST